MTIAAALLFVLAALPSESPIPRSASQVLLVVTPDWSAARGSLIRWQRSAGAWRTVGQPVAVVVGRAGLAWGRGLHDAALSVGGPLKQEGDGRAPAGVFRLGTAFGYDVSAPAGATWPYRPSTRASVCVDDPHAAAYNQIVEAPKPRPWRHAERLQLRDVDYRLGIVIEHNLSPVVAGAGSCVFVHIASPPDVPTSGCTALPPGEMDAVVRWLDPSARAVIVQLPERARAAWEKTWPGAPLATKQPTP